MCSLKAGQYELDFGPGTDSTMQLVVVPDLGIDDTSLRNGAERSVRCFAEPANSVYPNAVLGVGEHLHLQLHSSGRTSFVLTVEEDTQAGLFTKHRPEKFYMRILGEQTLVPLDCERLWVVHHEHDDDVTSIVIERIGDVDPEKFNWWLGSLIRERGMDIYRLKGFISLYGEDERFVFQGVHRLFTGQPDRPWGVMERCNQIVFIGRNLDEEGMNIGFDKCLI